MIQSKQEVKYLCGQLMIAEPRQIVIDLVQDTIEELLEEDSVPPDSIGSAAYKTSLLLEIYNPKFDMDIFYLNKLYNALNNWLCDATFANKMLGLDPNK